MSSYYATRNSNSNPYRNSTGGFNLSSSPTRTQIIIPVRPPSPAESTCSSCDSSLPLNTPWSSTPTGSSTHLQTERICTRSSRRMSTHSEGRPAPLVIHRPQYVSGGPLSAPLQDRRVYNDRSTRTLIVPASSMEHRDHRRSSSTGYTKYHHSIEHLEDNEFGSGGADLGRRGRTRFPRKLVNREAVEELGIPWTEESDGSIVVLRALDRTEIERLVDLTEEIRHRRHGSGKSVSFHSTAIIHDLPPRAPSPPPIIREERVVHHYAGERPSTPLTSENIAHLNSRSHDSSFSHTTTTTTTTTTEEPIFIPFHVTAPGATKITTTFTTPSFPLPQDSLSRAEEKAMKAEEKAQKLAVKADITGSRRDEQEAIKARVKAEEKKRRFEEKEWKERSKREDKEIRRREEKETVKIVKNHRGETLIIR